MCQRHFSALTMKVSVDAKKVHELGASQHVTCLLSPSLPAGVQATFRKSCAFTTALTPCCNWCIHCAYHLPAILNDSLMPHATLAYRISWLIVSQVEAEKAERLNAVGRLNGRLAERDRSIEELGQQLAGAEHKLKVRPAGMGARKWGGLGGSQSKQPFSVRPLVCVLNLLVPKLGLGCVSGG